MFKIEPFEPADENYKAIVAINRAVWSDTLDFKGEPTRS